MVKNIFLNLKTKLSTEHECMNINKTSINKSNFNSVKNINLQGVKDAIFKKPYLISKKTMQWRERQKIKNTLYKRRYANYQNMFSEGFREWV